MFWKRIESLEKQVKYLSDELYAVKIKQYQLENPFKYNIGDKVGKYLVVDRDYRDFSKFYKAYYGNQKTTCNLHEQELTFLKTKK